MGMLITTGLVNISGWYFSINRDSKQILFKETTILFPIQVLGEAHCHLKMAIYLVLYSPIKFHRRNEGTAFPPPHF